MEERSRKAPFLHGHKGNRWKYCRNFAGKANEKEADRKSLVASPIAWRHDLPALQAAYEYCRFFHLSGPVMEKGKNTGFSVAGGNGATEDRRSARLLKRSVRQRFRAGKDRADTTWSFRFPLKTSC